MLQTLGDAPLLGAVLQSSPLQQILCVLLGVVAYLVLASSLRFQRRRILHRKYSYYSTRESMGQMTDRGAWAIQKTIMQTEFPFIILKSLQFALFRVCYDDNIRHYSIANVDRHMESQPSPPFF